MDVNLTRISEAEHDAFFAMFAEYHAELDAYDAHAEDNPWDLETYRAALRADMDGRELYWVIVDGKTAGFLMVRVFPDWPNESRDVASIAEFYVARPYRRQGVGTAAIHALLADHRERGTFEVEAGILAWNAPAKAFWAGLGFDVRNIVTARKP